MFRCIVCDHRLACWRPRSRALQCVEAVRLRLARCCHGPKSPVSALLSDGFDWRHYRSKVDVFVSHAHEDRNIAQRLVRAIELGLQVPVDAIRCILELNVFVEG